MGDIDSMYGFTELIRKIMHVHFSWLTFGKPGASVILIITDQFFLFRVDCWITSIDKFLRLVADMSELFIPSGELPSLIFLFA